MRTIDLGNGWHLQTFGAPTVDGVLTDPGALGLLLGGIAFSLLLGLLIYLLGTGRGRALLLVHERTKELHHQAFTTR